LRDLIAKVIADLPVQRTCPCPNVLDGMKLPSELP